MIGSVRLEIARGVLRDGGSLSKAAEKIGVTRSELDVALWRNLGGKSPDQPPSARSEWTGKEIGHLKRAHAEGLTDPQIVSRLHQIGVQRSALSICNMRWKIGLPCNAPVRPREAVS